MGNTCCCCCHNNNKNNNNNSNNKGDPFIHNSYLSVENGNNSNKSNIHSKVNESHNNLQNSVNLLSSDELYYTEEYTSNTHNTNNNTNNNHKGLNSNIPPSPISKTSRSTSFNSVNSLNNPHNDISNNNTNPAHNNTNKSSKHSRIQQLKEHEINLINNFHLLPHNNNNSIELYIFPNSLVQQYAANSFLSYVNRYFRPCFNRKQLKKVAIPHFELSSFTSELITQSLINIEYTSEQEKLAVKIFKNILICMGDYTTSVPEKTQYNLTQTIINIALNHIELRDEIYVQLIKQLTNNKSILITSKLSGWKLMCLFVCNFSPSSNLRNTLLAFLAEQTQIPSDLSLDSNLSVSELAPSVISHYIRNCAIFSYFQCVKTSKGETFNIPTKLYENTDNSIKKLSKPSHNHRTSNNSHYLIPCNDLYDIEYIFQHGIRLYQFYFSTAIPFQMTLQRAESIKPQTPLIVHCTIQLIWLTNGHLTENIFKHSVDSITLQELKSIYEQNILDLNFITEHYKDPHIHSTLLLDYFTQLDEPLFPLHCYQFIVNNYMIPVEHINQTIFKQLQPDSIHCLQILLQFFNDLSTYYAHTGTSLNDLITLFCPELIRMASLPEQTKLLNLPKLQTFINTLTQANNDINSSRRLNNGSTNNSNNNKYKDKNEEKITNGRSRKKK